MIGAIVAAATVFLSLVVLVSFMGRGIYAAKNIFEPADAGLEAEHTD